MPKFLIEASLTMQGVKGLWGEGGTARREAVANAVKSVGGQLECFYFGFGDHDLIADFPDNERRGDGPRCELSRRRDHENDGAPDARGAQYP